MLEEGKLEFQTLEKAFEKSSHRPDEKANLQKSKSCGEPYPTSPNDMTQKYFLLKFIFKYKINFLSVISLY